MHAQIDRDNSLCDEILEDLIYYSLQAGQTIGETKVHHKQLEEASVCVECCIPLITLSDTDIVVSPAHIKLSKVACTLEAMD
jgi:hypothetical protein